MNLDDLEELASEVRAAGESCTHCVRVCMAAGCQSSGARPVLDRLNEQLGGREDVKVKSVGCMGLCSGGPLVEVQTRGQAAPVLYQNVVEADAAEVAASLGGEPVQRLRLPDGRSVFCAAAEDRPGEFGGDRPGGHQRLHRRRRLSGAGHRLDGDEPRRGAARDRDQRLARARRRRISVGPEVVDGRQNAGRPEVRHLQRGRRGSRRVHGPGGARVGPASRAGGHGHRGLRGGRQQGLHLHPGGISAGHRSLEDRDSAGDAQGLAGFEHLRNAVQFRDRTAAGRRSVRLRRGNGLDGVRGRGTGPAQPAAAVSGGSPGCGAIPP